MALEPAEALWFSVFIIQFFVLYDSKRLGVVSPNSL